MATEKIDLKKATIFDLTDNEKLIEEVLGYLPDREEYETYAGRANIAAHMIDYAEHVHDAELVKQIEEAHKEELAALFSE